MVCQEGDRPALYHGGPLCRTRDREDESSLSASLSPLARQSSDARSRSPGQQGRLTSCTARPADTSGARQALAGPMLPPRSSRTFRALAVIPRRRAGTAGRGRCLPQKFAVPLLLIFFSYCGDAARCPPAARQGSGKARTGRIARGNPAAQKKTPTGMETGGRQESFYGCGARDQNSL